MKHSKQAYIYAALAILLWGTIPTAFKIALSELSIVTMLGITTLVSTAVLFLIMLLTGKINMLRKTTRNELLWSALLGLITPVGYYLILLTAYSRLPGQVAQPINMIWPIFLVFFSIPLLGQRIPARSFLALAISLTGVYPADNQRSVVRVLAGRHAGWLPVSRSEPAHHPAGRHDPDQAARHAASGVRRRVCAGRGTRPDRMA